MTHLVRTASPSRNDDLRDLSQVHRRHWGTEAEFFARAPGRVNLLGGHIDYSEGWVLPGAIDRSVQIVASARTDHTVRVCARDLGRTCEIDLHHLAPPVERDGRPTTWQDYFAGVAWIVREESESLESLNGCDLTIASTLPMGVGVSSSAALTVAQLLIWRALQGALEPPDTREKTRMARRARAFENRYLGVQSGLMDPYASLHGEEEQLLLLDCRTECHERIPWNRERTLLLIDSGIERRLSGSGFNDRRAECARAVEWLRPTHPQLRTLRDLPADQIETACADMPETLARRARHVSTECRRVLRGARALEAGDWATFAEQMNRSHLSSRDNYETSLPELDLLATTAAEHPGCDGARLSGAGFGGAVLAVVQREEVSGLRQRLTEEYLATFQRQPTFLEVQIGAGAESGVL